MQLTLAPATSEQLSRLRTDPGALAAVLAPFGDTDRRTLRHGGVVRLGTGWPILHALLTRASEAPELGFLAHGGTPVGHRARAFRSEAAAGIAAAMASAGVRVHPEPDGLLVREQLEELGNLLQSTSDARALLVVGDATGGIDVHLVGDAAIDRYVAAPEVLDAHLAEAPAAPTDAVVLQAWYALQVGLNELGATAAHRFVEDGGELLDEESQLRIFDPAEVEALRAVLSAVTPAELRGALSPRLLEREGLEAEEAELANHELSTLRTAVGSWADHGRAMLSFMS